MAYLWRNRSVRLRPVAYLWRNRSVRPRSVEKWVGAFEAAGSAVWPRLLKILGKNPFKQSLVREKGKGKEKRVERKKDTEREPTAYLLFPPESI